MSPRSSEQNEKIRAERIRQILTAAVDVYLEKGIRGTEMGEIAKKAGMARGLVYYYYKDKMELFRDLFSRYMQTAWEYIQSRLSAEEEVLVKLKNYTRFYLEMASYKPQLMRFYTNMENDIELVFESEAEDVQRDFYDKAKKPLVDLFVQAMEEGKLRKCHPKIIVNVYWGALTGIMGLFAGGQIAEKELEQTIDLVVQLIFEGLQSHTSLKVE